MCRVINFDTNEMGPCYLPHAPMYLQCFGGKVQDLVMNGLL